MKTPLLALIFVAALSAGTAVAQDLTVACPDGFTGGVDLLWSADGVQSVVLKGPDGVECWSARVKPSAVARLEARIAELEAEQAALEAERDEAQAIIDAVRAAVAE